MALHLLKLCVGADSIADLEAWIAAFGRGRVLREHIHTTRMMPKRVEELLAGGSLYWVIKGQIAARQGLRAIRPFTDGAGIGRCDLVLDPAIIPLRPRPCRPFQGWRYLKPEDAPRDASDEGADAQALPEPMRRQLRDLGLL